MTKSFKIEEITKISVSNREATQKLLLQAGFELDEIWEHDNGDNYEVWSQPKTNKQIVWSNVQTYSHYRGNHCYRESVEHVIQTLLHYLLLL